MIRLLLAALVFVGIVVWQVWQILRADLPALRAVQAVAFVIPVFLCSYAVGLRPAVAGERRQLQRAADAGPPPSTSRS